MFGKISFAHPAALSASVEFVRAMLGKAVMVRFAVVTIAVEV